MKRQIVYILSLALLILFCTQSLTARQITYHSQVWGEEEGEGWLLLPKDDAVKITSKGYIVVAEDDTGKILKYRKYLGLFGTITENNGKVWWAMRFAPVESGPPPLLSISGKWYSYYAKHNINRAPCQITQKGNSLTFINEFGATSKGVILNKATVIAQDWEGGLKGTVSNDGQRIDWANGSFWVK